VSRLSDPEVARSMRRLQEARAQQVATARGSRLAWGTVKVVDEPLIAGRGGRATVALTTSPAGAESQGIRWFEHRPVAGDTVLVELPPPGGTRRIVAIDREITGGGGNGLTPNLPYLDLRDYDTGAVSGDDVTLGMTAWWADAVAGVGLPFIPPGNWHYSGSGLVGSAPGMKGVGNLSCIHNHSDVPLISVATGQQRAVFEDFAVIGGRGLWQQTYLSPNPQYGLAFRRLWLSEYNHVAIGSLSKDIPFVTIEQVLFDGNRTSSKGVCLAGDSAGGVIRDCWFWRNRIHIHLARSGLAFNISGNNQFLRYAGTDASHASNVDNLCWTANHDIWFDPLAGTKTTLILAADVDEGDSVIHPTGTGAITGVAVGDTVTLLSSDGLTEQRTIAATGTAGSGGTGLTLDSSLEEGYSAGDTVIDSGVMVAAGRCDVDEGKKGPETRGPQDRWIVVARPLPLGDGETYFDALPDMTTPSTVSSPAVHLHDYRVLDNMVLITTLSADAHVGDTLLHVTKAGNARWMAALRIGAGGTVDYGSVANRDWTANTVTLDTPLANDHSAGEAVQETNGVAGPDMTRVIPPIWSCTVNLDGWRIGELEIPSGIPSGLIEFADPTQRMPTGPTGYAGPILITGAGVASAPMPLSNRPGWAPLIDPLGVYNDSAPDPWLTTQGLPVPYQSLIGYRNFPNASASSNDNWRVTSGHCTFTNDLPDAEGQNEAVEIMATMDLGSLFRMSSWSGVTPWPGVPLWIFANLGPAESDPTPEFILEILDMEDLTPKGSARRVFKRRYALPPSWRRLPWMFVPPSDHDLEFLFRVPTAGYGFQIDWIEIYQAYAPADRWHLYGTGAPGGVVCARVGQTYTQLDATGTDVLHFKWDGHAYENGHEHWAKFASGLSNTAGTKTAIVTE
jgi:hypothetical protein